LHHFDYNMLRPWCHGRMAFLMFLALLWFIWSTITVKKEREQALAEFKQTPGSCLMLTFPVTCMIVFVIGCLWGSMKRRTSPEFNTVIGLSGLGSLTIFFVPKKF
jgi:hypothetical protein